MLTRPAVLQQLVHLGAAGRAGQRHSIWIPTLLLRLQLRAAPVGISDKQSQCVGLPLHALRVQAAQLLSYQQRKRVSKAASGRHLCNSLPYLRCGFCVERGCSDEEETVFRERQSVAVKTSEPLALGFVADLHIGYQFRRNSPNTAEDIDVAGPERRDVPL